MVCRFVSGKWRRFFVSCDVMAMLLSSNVVRLCRHMAGEVSYMNGFGGSYFTAVYC